MPLPALPPTPASSTEIAGKVKNCTQQLDHGFKLPPAAMDTQNTLLRNDEGTNLAKGCNMSNRGSRVLSASSSTFKPISPAPLKDASSKRISKRRSKHITFEDADSFVRNAFQMPSPNSVIENGCSLPPPPTRSRKIIQMKPGPVQDTVAQGSDVDLESPPGMFLAQNKTPEAHVVGASSKSRAMAAVGSESKARRRSGDRDAATGVTPAGRKIARKTAHSLIERRRRSKMNEEFAVLKNMIPACVGQEMHKLAILQASIDYMRYLERCINDLQTNNHIKQNTSTTTSSRKSSFSHLPTLTASAQDSISEPFTEKGLSTSKKHPNNKENPFSDETMVDADCLTYITSLKSSSQAIPARSSRPESNASTPSPSEEHQHGFSSPGSSIQMLSEIIYPTHYRGNGAGNERYTHNHPSSLSGGGANNTLTRTSSAGNRPTQMTALSFSTLSDQAIGNNASIKLPLPTRSDKHRSSSPDSHALLQPNNNKTVMPLNHTQQLRNDNTSATTIMVPPHSTLLPASASSSAMGSPAKFRFSNHPGTEPDETSRKNYALHSPGNTSRMGIDDVFASSEPGSTNKIEKYEVRQINDHEATAALLMLNSDRRAWGGARGMSVKDLLSN